ncbi:DNA (cytosine-5-)-methyltransferase [Methylosinus sp. H3A]|uniref:DNA cytosine methyltransferase n=1 Tax=Methylosinus sp. H3A TaxID=2785786 RepID=UPI0018C2864A|nr:DNA (cytosine-5-)-methyltransferase [Methylosinus sp. H3A]MBG0808315.1 DNA (cytosine-5-)-methyltransferase [Methylosinus sp. H3A]
MKVVGLFAGIGGLELGLSRAGHERLMFSEVWPLAAQVLAAHFPETPNVGDVAALRGLPGETELVAAGFPCQDLSQAGRTQGIEGRKSSLVEHVFRLLDETPAPYALLENVSFMLSLDRGRAMARLVAAFEERGYLWAYRVVNTLAFLPQRRERVLFLASRAADPADILLVDEAAPCPRATSLPTHAHGFYWTEGVRGLGWAPDCVPTLKNGSTLGIASPPAILLPGGEVVTPDIRDAERLQGFPADWTAPAEALGRANWRWSLVGNAVSAPVAEWVGGRLEAPGDYDPARDGAPLEEGARWPRAARYDGDRRFGVEISAFPVWREREPLHLFLQHPGKPLSARAAAGFLARTQRAKLRFEPGFRESVAAHLEAMLAARSLVAAE